MIDIDKQVKLLNDINIIPLKQNIANILFLLFLLKSLKTVFYFIKILLYLL